MGFDALVIIGGDYSLQYVQDLVCAGIPTVAIPKTIDNDIGLTTSIGFSTAIQTGVDALDNLKTTAQSHKRAMVVELMGRDAGFLPLSVAVAGGADVALLPEVPFQKEGLIQAVKSRLEEDGSAIIVVSEALTDSKKDTVAGSIYTGAADAVVNMLSEHVCGVRSVTLGHLQRGGAPNAQDRLLATRLGSFAVDMIARKEFNKMASWWEGRYQAMDMSKLSTVTLAHQRGLLCAARDMGIFVGDFS